MDIELFPIGDWQIGSTVALHPNVRRNKNGKYEPLTKQGGWYYSDRPNFYPSSLQVKIWEHFENCLSYVEKSRVGKKLFILKMGDEVDGDHHGTPQLVTRHVTEQTNTAIELNEYLKKRVGYKSGDLLACLQGTNVHVGIQEQEIGRQIGAIEHEIGVYAAPFLNMVLNGVRVWAYHKGVSAGQGQTRGNACVLKLKQIYYQCLQDNVEIPDIVISAHTHDQHSATWTRPDGKVMHYLITPPWQDKTRFVFDNMATNRNKVGIQTVTIKDNGIIVINPPMLMASPLGYSVISK